MPLLKCFKSIIIVTCLLPQILWGMKTDEFIKWWNDYRNQSIIPVELKQMEDYFVNSNLISYSSNYWNVLNKKNIEQISTYGYENFKQTVARNYFTWNVSLDHSYASKLIQSVPQLIVGLDPAEFYQVHPLWGTTESLEFNTVTLYLLNYMLINGAAPFLDKLEEPLIGNPPFVTYNNRRVSQDILNSLLEFIPVSQNCPMENISTIVEIGAGSGRTAFCYMTLLPHVKYVIADIPPALYVSQKYLADVFPEKKVMKFRPFSSFEEIAEEYAQADIVFLTPDQLLSLPDGSADLFLAIDCLHEMKPGMISHYFNEAERLCSYFYFKCWQQTTVPYDGNNYSSESYPVRTSWQKLFREDCVIPSEFFHAIYRMK